MTLLSHKDRAGFGRIGIILILPFLILAVSFVVYKLFFVPDPIVDGLEDLKLLPSDKTVRISTQNVQFIRMTVFQEGMQVDLLEDSPETGGKVYSLEINPEKMGLKDGRAIITVVAEAGILKKKEYDLEVVIDTVPPRLQVLKAPSAIHVGSGGLAVLRASGEKVVFIRLVDKSRKGADLIFKAFKIQPDEGGQSEPDKPSGALRALGNTYYTFFPAPFDAGEESIFYAEAVDEAGNKSIKSLQSRIKKKKFRTSSITVDRMFIDRVVAPLINETDIADHAGAFKKANEELREQSLNKLKVIAEETVPELLWDGRFLQMKNSKVMATYGDSRTYVFNGEKISKSAHLGYDLASFAKAPVEAANDGIVRFADNLSIYGKTVVIDHGLGLMSLYGHLSDISVIEGQEVQKGEIIARSGATGLAGGDHLHFGVLIHGYEVSPLYWWDTNWIRINVLSLIEQES